MISHRIAPLCFVCRMIPVVGLALLLAATAGAQVPTTMSYQGRLLENTADQDAATGTVDIVFSLWSDPSGGSELWTESWTGVPLSNGIFSVLLGSNGSPLDPADFQGDSSLYLQLVVDGETLSPRQMLGSAPFAVVDEPTNELQDLDLSGNDLSLSGDPTPAAVDLSPYLDNTDAQDLALSGHSLVLTNDPSPVDLGAYEQTLDLTGDALTISGSGSSVDLSTTASLVSLSGRIGQLEEAAGSGPRRVFATSPGVSAAMGGVSGGDAFCQARADAAGLGGQFFAWLSDESSSPADRFDRRGSFVLVDGTRVADDWADLVDGHLDHAISLDQNGTPVSGVAWTGTNPNGTAHPDTCEGWTVADSASRGRLGDVPAANPTWTNLLSASCDSTRRLYCFEGRTLSLEDQVLSLAGDHLQLTSNDGPDVVSLAGYLDNTDNQVLSLSGSTLSLTSEDGTDVVSLAAYLDNTDAQDLALSGHNLVLTNDPSPVDLGAYEQTLDLTGDTLAISGSGSSVDLSTTTTLVDLAGRVGHLEGAAEGPRRVFATSTQVNGAFGGVAGGDALCQSLADAAGLGGRYLAWLSDSVSSPASRFDRLGSFQLVNGTTVADDWADLTDRSIDRAISLDENGNPVSGFAWTGTSDNGTLLSDGATCANWTSSSSAPPRGTSGRVTSTSEWTVASFQTCNTPSRLYCFERTVSSDNQVLSLSGNDLQLTSDDGTDTVNLAGFLDNTDNQELALEGTSLTLSADSGGYTVSLAGFLDNTDNQVLSLSGSTLSLTSDDGIDSVDLGGFTNIDNQALSLSGNTLSLTSDDGTDTVDLAGYLDNTDHQVLSLSGNTLRLTSHIGNHTVDLTGFLDNTDNQNIASVLANGIDAGDQDLINLDDVDIDKLTVSESFDCNASTADCIDSSEIEQNTILGNDITTGIFVTYVECNGECTDIRAYQACDAAANEKGLPYRLEFFTVSCLHNVDSTSANGFAACNDGGGNIGDNECSTFEVNSGSGLPCLDGSGADAMVTCLRTDFPR